MTFTDCVEDRGVDRLGRERNLITTNMFKARTFLCELVLTNNKLNK